MKLLVQPLLEKLNEICVDGVSINVSMAEVSNWRVGGYVSIFIAPSSVQELIKIRKIISVLQVPSLVVGNTTNLLFTDADINAVVIHIGSSLAGVSIEGEKVVAQAGLWVPMLARKAMQAGLTGLEHTCGIPGTLGGLVVMNGGSQRKGIGENVIYVKTVDKLGRVREYNNEECGFSYRNSIFQGLDEVVVEVGLKLSYSEGKHAVRAEMLSILRERRKKFPRRLPNCGSVFVSDPAMYPKYGPPGKIIEACSLKGVKKGAVEVSREHANFIVNHGGACAEDIMYLIDHIRTVVFDKTGFLMAVEPKYVDGCGRVVAI